MSKDADRTTAEDRLSLGYREALVQFRLHPALIWTRNNFFMLVQSGLLAFFVNQEKSLGAGGRTLICVGGAFLAFMWLWTNYAGQQLQRAWRNVALEYEKRLFNPERRADGMSGPFELAHRRIGEGRRFAVSITTILIILPLGFEALWLVLLFVPRLFN